MSDMGRDAMTDSREVMKKAVRATTASLRPDSALRARRQRGE